MTDRQIDLFLALDKLGPSTGRDLWLAFHEDRAKKSPAPWKEYGEWVDHSLEGIYNCLVGLEKRGIVHRERSSHAEPYVWFVDERFAEMTR